MNLDLDTRFRDKLDPEAYCPGFDLWNVLGTDGKHYIVSADTADSAQVRVYLRSNGAIDVASIAWIGENPDVAAWDEARA